MKHALKAIADVYHIELHEAAQYRRQNPLIGDEIQIEQELVNLEEAMQAYWSARGAFTKYPQIHQHLAIERHQALKHCIGLLVRMLKQEPLRHPYEQKDIALALRRLARLVCDELKAAGREMDRKTVHVLAPLLSWRQRLEKRSGKMSVRIARFGASNRFASL